MKKINSWIPKKYYPATINYLLFIVLLNTIFSYIPNFNILGEPISAADFVVGLVYVMRDFAQRESKHLVLVAMVLGCIASWMLAEHQAALASVAAFGVGESLDWGIYTYTKKPISQRILYSSLISSPADSAVNLFFLFQLWIKQNSHQMKYSTQTSTPYSPQLQQKNKQWLFALSNAV